MEDVAEKLSLLGLDPAAYAEAAAELLQQAAQYPGAVVSLALGPPVTLNGDTLAASAWDPRRGPLVPLRKLGEQLGIQVGWDPAAGSPTLAGTPVPALVRQGRSYLDLEGVRASRWDGGRGAVEISALTVGLNGVPLWADVWVEGGSGGSGTGKGVPDGIMVPVSAALALGQEVAVEATAVEGGGLTAWISGLPVPAAQVDGKVYLRAGPLAAALGGALVWDPARRYLDILVPSAKMGIAASAR